MGNAVLNWGILVVGLVLFYFGCLFVVQYARAYKRHVLIHGRFRYGKEYGTSWDRADTQGVVSGVIFWIVVIPVVVGLLLFFLTGLVEIGIPLLIGCTLGIGGILLLLYAFTSGAGLAKREAEIAFRNLPKDIEAEVGKKNDITYTESEADRETVEYTPGKCPYCGESNPDVRIQEGPYYGDEREAYGYTYLWDCHCHHCGTKWYALER